MHWFLWYTAIVILILLWNYGVHKGDEEDE